MIILASTNQETREIKQHVHGYTANHSGVGIQIRSV